jgi:hypothetical protein
MQAAESHDPITDGVAIATPTMARSARGMSVELASLSLTCKRLLHRRALRLGYFTVTVALREAMSA